MRLAEPSKAAGNRRGFTLIELLVVIAIIAILIALLVPAVQKVREAAARTQCQNNLKQLALGLHNFHDVNKVFPAGNLANNVCCGQNVATTWSIDVLPYVEQDNLFRSYKGYGSFANADQEWAGANTNFRTAQLSIYQCPMDLWITKTERPASGNGSGAVFAFASYRAVSGRSGGNGRVFWDTCEPGLGTLNLSWRGVLHGVVKSTNAATTAACPTGSRERMPVITDGTSNTLLLGEYTNNDVPRRSTFWAYGYTSYNQSTVTDQSRILGTLYLKCANLPGSGEDNPCKRGFGANHTGGLNFALADGSVRFFTYSIDINVLAALATMAGGEVITGGF